MKVSEILKTGVPTLSFEVFPPKKSDTADKIFGAVKEVADFRKFVVVKFVFRHDNHGHLETAIAVGRLDIALGVAEESHAGIELDAVLRLLVERGLHLEHHLFGLL